jgi:hypothetical protein
MCPFLNLILFVDGRKIKMALSYAVDVWDDPDASCIFLTHLHQDHMVRMCSYRQGRIYGTTFTLKHQPCKRFRDHEVKMCALPILQWVSIPELPQKCQVALIPAHHCAGSVMVVIKDGRSQPHQYTLHTGDWKWYDALPDHFQQLGITGKIQHLFYDDTYTSCGRIPDDVSAKTLKCLQDEQRKDGKTLVVAKNTIGIEYMPGVQWIGGSDLQQAAWKEVPPQDPMVRIPVISMQEARNNTNPKLFIVTLRGLTPPIATKRTGSLHLCYRTHASSAEHQRFLRICVGEKLLTCEPVSGNSGVFCK